MLWDLLLANAMTEWPNGGMPFAKQDIKNRVLITSDLDVPIHNVERNQTDFIEVFGRDVLPNLRLG